MSNSKKRNIIIGSLCAIVLLMAVGYAAFQTVLNIEGTSNITSSWDIKITNVTSKNIKGTASNNGNPTFENLSATFKTNLQAPGDSIEYDITVTNNGSLNARLDKYVLTDANNEAIKFTQTGLTNGEVLTAGGTKTFTVKVEYLSSVSEQPTNTISNLTVTLNYVQAANGSTPSGESAADKLIKTAVTSGDGLYIDTYESGRYVYKGANPNNYITFNNEEWRVMAIEADGTLKIRKNTSIGNMAFDTKDATIGRNNINNTYCQINSGVYWGCNAWTAVEETFTNGNKTGTVTQNATLNTYLNNNYYNSLSSDARIQIQSHAYGIGVVIYDDKGLYETIIGENATTWNGRIGLMSVSDYLKANTNIEECGNLNLNNTNYSSCKTTNYLYSKNYCWTISPFAGLSDGVFSLYDYGRVDSFYAGNGSNSVYPSLYLKLDITLAGEGTQEKPYTIK